MSSKWHKIYLLFTYKILIAKVKQQEEEYCREPTSQDVNGIVGIDIDRTQA